MPDQPADYKLGPDGSCPVCGQRHVRMHRGVEKITCAGHSRWDRDETRTHSTLRDEPKPCGALPAPGLDRCGSHGVNRKQRQAAKQRIAEERERKRMQQLAATLGEPIDGDPGEIVAQRIAARNGHVQWLLARVRQLEPDALTWGRTKATEGDVVVGNGGSATLQRGAATVDEAKPHIWYALYVDAARDLERLCIDAIRAGLEERRVRVSEQYADMWVRVIDGMLRELGHDPNDPATAEVVARHLDVIAA